MRCLEHFGSTEAYLPVLEAIGRLVREGGAARHLLRRYAPTWFAQLPWLLEEEDAEHLERELLAAARPLAGLTPCRATVVPVCFQKSLEFG